mmetsp:Transcript_48561/g.128083  ORF Transcript_48561/g.128083 Transcript_48561/m.128083 type:complete len:204 (-) Transcript_48561:3-614(-)
MNAYGLSGCSLMTLCTSSCVNSTRLCLSRYSRAALAWPCLDDAAAPPEPRLPLPSPPLSSLSSSSLTSSAGATAMVTLFSGCLLASPPPAAAPSAWADSKGMVYWQSVRFSSPGRRMSRALATGSRTSTLKGTASEAEDGKRKGRSAATGACRRVEPARTERTQPSGMPSVSTTCSSMLCGRQAYKQRRARHLDLECPETQMA